MPDDRFQFQPGYMRLWRLRHYLCVPLHAVIIWLWRNYSHLHTDLRFWPNSFAWAWSTAIGEAQVRMKWMRTLAELKGNIKELP